jgi:hypothetical protein
MSKTAQRPEKASLNVMYSDVFVEAVGEVEVVVEVGKVAAETDVGVVDMNEVEAVEVVLPPLLAALCPGNSTISCDLETIRKRP